MRTFTRAFVAASAAALALVASSCGGTNGSPGASAERTIEVKMSDNAYQPASFRVSKGETVTFTFTNNGTVKHEAILGDDAAQMAHHDEMTASTGQMDHDRGHSTGSGDTISVAPGMTGQITHTFNEAGTMIIGCHEPGHWEAGMKANVTIG